ncbi:carbonic anhydrase [Helicostylum pulchrum]|nr:carbonic anhydrase [Helicostylum pulchrum]
MTIVNDGSKVIAGSQSGALYMWDWNDWNKTTKWIGHPSSVDSICKLDENAICTGASDGLLRFISISPQKFEGILGDHGQDFPIESVKMNHTNYLASCGHDLQLRFWNIQFLFEQNSRKHDLDDSNNHDHWDKPLTKRPKTRLVNQSVFPTSNTSKFDVNDIDLDGLLAKNKLWAESILEEDPNFFKRIATMQQPKILWIGCSDSRVPANSILQLGPGEVFVHRNIANVVSHSDLNCLSVLQYAVEVLKVEHIIVCGHYNCGGVGAAHGHGQYGLIDNWLRNIKDVYRLHKRELEAIEDNTVRLHKLIELNVINSAENVCHSTIVQNAWQNGQKLTVHAWAYDIESG